MNRQIRRSFASWWPRTERQLYGQPKLFVEHGFATAAADSVGRRPRTVYSITPAGRAALYDWLGDEPTPCAMEWDLIVKVFFAEQGTKEQLLDNLRRTAESFHALTETAIADTDQLFAADYPYPHRHHLFALIAKLDFDVCASIEKWLEWAARSRQLG
ncbi:MAG: PadR family transcriptional regulator [Ilumatobacteraceae bacterium]